MLVNLEDIFEFQPEDKPIVILDCRVVLIRLLASLRKASLDESKIKDWISASWCAEVNDPLGWLRAKPANGYTVVVVDDWRNDDSHYWRHEYFPGYKGSRSTERPADYSLSHETLLANLGAESSKIKVIRECGFEADDWAGLAYRIRRESPTEFVNRPIFLLTVDSDWLQLVDDSMRIYWANDACYKPRLRTEYEALYYFANKGYQLFKASEIANIKAQFGDQSDDLPPGSDIGLIDLINPTVVPSEAGKKLLKEAMLGPCNTSQANATKAKRWLIRNSGC